MLIRAAGAVAWRPGPDGDEVALVHRVRYDDWSLPKGKQEPGEQLPVTAVREVREEAGAIVTLGRKLASVRYRVNGNPKQVSYWSARATAIDASVIPNNEVDEVAWLPVDEAIRRASYRQDVAVLTDFATGVAGTTPLVLLRHAKAVGRSEWRKQDLERPLDKAGVADAATLAGLLACFAPRARVASSPAIRCLDTVRPYGDLTGVPVQAEDALATTPLTNPAASSSFICSLVEAGEAAIVCAHRENLPALLDAALAISAGPQRPQLSDKVVKPLPKGAFLVLHLTRGTLAAIDRYEFSDD